MFLGLSQRQPAVGRLSVVTGDRTVAGPLGLGPAWLGAVAAAALHTLNMLIAAEPVCPL